jgi:phenylpropionate dioxygenase-like ring-hydroxylating dioxygenase large terminal subunit
MTTPAYVAGIDFNPSVRADAFGVMARLVEHYRNQSTDRAESQWREPVRNYRDPVLWQREIDAVHKKVPLPLALSCELPEPDTYKAIDVAGTPVLITRDRKGDVHAMLNVCRHRGSELVPEGTGRTKRLTCPYHAWSYDLAGCLTGVYGEETFGGVDRSAMGLVALPAVERAGIVFVSLDPKATIDLDTWLGPELINLLEAMALDSTYHYSTRWLDGPNWKVVIDGYLEGYHFASLHRTTVYRTNFSNMAAFDPWGPHQRNAFALRPIAHAAEKIGRAHV